MDSNLSTLVSMGFEAPDAEAALRAQDGDVERAVEHLVSTDAATGGSPPNCNSSAVNVGTAQPAHRTTPDTRAVQYITFRHNHGPCYWILNILWILLGGWHMFLTWFTTGVVLCLTCVFIPCGWQVIKISMFLLFPFGVNLISTDEDIHDDAARCCSQSCNCVLNIIWAITVGWFLALQAIVTGVLLCITIIGIPFGISCFKLAYLSFCPFGFGFTTEDLEVVAVTTNDDATNYQVMQGRNSSLV